MKTLEQIIEQTRAKAASDESAAPPRIAHVEFTREELLKVLRPRAAQSKRAKELCAGVSAVSKGKSVIVQREHLLVALGALPEENEDDDNEQPGGAGPDAGAGAAADV
jgi:hypothetical protein